MSDSFHPSKIDILKPLVVGNDVDISSSILVLLLLLLLVVDEDDDDKERKLEIGGEDVS